MQRAVAMKHGQAMQRGQTRRVRPTALQRQLGRTVLPLALKGVPPPTATRGICNPTVPRRPIPETPPPTSDTSSNKASWPTNRIRTTRGCSSNRKETINRLKRKTTTTRKNSRWNSATLNKPKGWSKSTLPNSSRCSNVNSHGRVHQDRRRTVLPRVLKSAGLAVAAIGGLP